MSKIENNALGAVGEHQTLSRLLLMGYQAAITNLSIENATNTDILCRDDKGRFAAIQVKTTCKNSFLTGNLIVSFMIKTAILICEQVEHTLNIRLSVRGPWYKYADQAIARHSNFSYCLALK